MTRREIAEEYVRKCLAIMDGSAEEGIKRIGTTRYEETIKSVIKVLPELPAPAPEVKE